ncbi:MAG: biopolymer transporter ExbD [Alphaproteobacteria bacterium]|nr:biopolymer transporter ExbD [Alphaproteobacteria bacterium]
MALLIKKKKSIDINVAPLIDIVFLLLIFFMLTSEFTDFKTIDMISPNQNSASIEKKNLPIIINLSEEGLIEIDKAEVKLENLSEIIQMKLINSNNKKIVISTLNETKINNLIIVVDMIRSLGIENIALITKEK